MSSGRNSIAIVVRCARVEAVQRGLIEAIWEPLNGETVATVHDVRDFVKDKVSVSIPYLRDLLIRE